MEQNIPNVEQHSYEGEETLEVSYGEQLPEQEGGVRSEVNVYRTQNGIPVGATYFKGVGMESHAEAEVTKAESALIWIIFILGIGVGAFVSWKLNPFIGIFLGILIATAGMFGVGARAFLRQGDKEGIKVLLLALIIFGGVFLLIGSVGFVLFFNGVF